MFLDNGSGVVDIGEVVLMQDPIGFESFWGFSGVEDELLFDLECPGLSNVLVYPSLPVPGSSCPVRP
ncbi:hypothetical protein ACFX2I_000055 [Malus domestica]